MCQMSLAVQMFSIISTNTKGIQKLRKFTVSEMSLKNHMNYKSPYCAQLNNCCTLKKIALPPCNVLNRFGGN